jgi:hypothetical protein
MVAGTSNLKARKAPSRARTATKKASGSLATYRAKRNFSITNRMQNEAKRRVTALWSKSMTLAACTTTCGWSSMEFLKVGLSRGDQAWFPVRSASPSTPRTIP